MLIASTGFWPPRKTREFLRHCEGLAVDAVKVQIITFCSTEISVARPVSAMKIQATTVTKIECWRGRWTAETSNDGAGAVVEDGVDRFEAGVVDFDAGNYYGAEHYGAAPTVIGTSATVDDPAGTLATLTGRPAAASARVVAETVNGSIDGDDFGLAVEKGFVGRDLNGKIGGGDARVSLDTVNGSIRIKKN